MRLLLCCDRLHLFEWEARIFSTLPPPTSFPSQRTDWTERMKPGLASYADDPSKVGEHLQPLVDFAIEKLKGREEEFHTYPIFLKATGGMRQLPYKKREAVMNAVREYMNDKSKVPFYFEQDFARIISGEEEAIYAWTAVNFLMGTLVPQLVGTGTVDANETYGALALGGASAQIAFFLPSQDISANMFKLQVGAQKHWNLYGHSFLWFGLDLARTRFHNRLAEDAVSDESSTSSTSSTSSAETVVNYCFPSGYEETVEWDGRKVKLVAPSHSDLDVDDDDDSDDKRRVAVVRSSGKDDDQEQNDEFDDKIYDYDDDPPSGREARKLALCMKQTLPLLRLEANEWCEFSHGKGQCSYNGEFARCFESSTTSRTVAHPICCSPLHSLEQQACTSHRFRTRKEASATSWRSRATTTPGTSSVCPAERPSPSSLPARRPCARTTWTSSKTT